MGRKILTPSSGNGSGQVYILNPEILGGDVNLRAVCFDLDGTITQLHDKRIYQLIWENVCSFLPENIQKYLKGYDSLGMINQPSAISWFLDTELGYAVLVDSEGKVIEVKKGEKLIKDNKIPKIYKNRQVNVCPSLPSTPEKLRFLPYGDGFDLISLLIKSAVISGVPQSELVKYFNEAFYKAHSDPENGFKARLLSDLEGYGIKKDERMVGFFRDVSSFLPILLMSTSPPFYSRKILEHLDIAEYFSKIIADTDKYGRERGVRKPACFSMWRSANKRMWEQFQEVNINTDEHSKSVSLPQIEDPSQVLYGGDNPRKDLYLAHKMGFITMLRVTPKDLGALVSDIVRCGKLFEGKENMLVLSSGGNGVIPLMYTQQILDSVDVVATDISDLRPLLLNLRHQY